MSRVPTTPVLDTARLELRPYALRDVDALHRLWNDPHVRRYLWDDTVIARETAAAQRFALSKPVFLPVCRTSGGSHPTQAQ